MKNSEDTVFKVFLAAAYFPCLFLSVSLRGWALSVMWSWFIVPVFGLPVLNIPYAIGLACVAGFVTKQDVDCEPKDESFARKVSKGIVGGVATPLIVLAFAWVVHLFC